MIWAFLAVLALIAGLTIRRRRSATVENGELWRASLVEEDDGELDLEAIRQAEEEWERSEEWDTGPDDGDDWR